ncbi:LPXTG cell wall anchor domain-containing protein [Staphylococcus rostri]
MSTSMHTSESMSQDSSMNSTSMSDKAKAQLPETGQAAPENNYGLMGGAAALLGGLGLLKRSKKEKQKEQSDQ